MFEDSTFESTGRIRTGSRNWMMATFALNSCILMALILIPLIYPQALPRMAMSMLMEAPARPAPEPKPQPQRTTVAQSQLRDNSVLAPSRIPSHALILSEPEPASHPTIADLGGGSGPSSDLFRGQARVNVVRAMPRAPEHISSGVASGLLIGKTVPSYPMIAKAARVQGTVILQATISRNGTIENLRAVGGPAMLHQAALDAVKSWRYRPYLLDGAPVDVETTVNVIFTLQ